ncbi:MAG: lipopolysaccharide biosynthesis protein, partial [Desulfomonilaceae bacterium]
MASLKLNILANYAGSFCRVVIGLVFVPLYVKFLGVESYGLIGFYATLESLFLILDMGLGATINRELARRSSLQGQEQSCRDMLRTLETIYWIMAIVIAVSLIAMAPLMASYWIKPQHLSEKDVQDAIVLMGIVTFSRWPLGVYQGGLNGLQKQVLLNILNSVFALSKGVLAVLVLWLVQPTIFW